MVHWLWRHHGLTVFCDHIIKECPDVLLFQPCEPATNLSFQACAFESPETSRRESCPVHIQPSIDFCITVGGDGTVLRLNALFSGACTPPPIVSFARGSLGFLTPFDMRDYQRHLTNVIKGHETPLPICLRMRLMCRVQRQCKHGDRRSDDAYVWQPLNEMVLHRGLSSNLSAIDLFLHHPRYSALSSQQQQAHTTHVTRVEADGLVVSTPTGSTAYSLSAGEYHCPRSSNTDTDSLFLYFICVRRSDAHPVCSCNSYHSSLPAYSLLPPTCHPSSVCRHASNTR